MPSSTPKQQRFFQAVKRAKHDPNYGDETLRKVANSMTDKDIDDFAGSIAELRIKKAVLGILKDIREPMYLNEDETEGSTNPVAKTFQVEDVFATYIKKYVGQPLAPKELEAIRTYKEQGGTEPTKVERTEIWYESTDKFNNSNTIVIKKMKDGTQFSFNAFSKYSPVEPEQPEPDMGTEEPPMGTEPPMGGPEGMAPGPEGVPPPGAPTPPAEPEPEPQKPEEKKDKIVVTKSILFKDEIKGGSILAEFLKKLDI